MKVAVPLGKNVLAPLANMTSGSAINSVISEKKYMEEKR